MPLRWSAPYYSENFFGLCRQCSSAYRPVKMKYALALGLMSAGLALSAILSRFRARFSLGVD